MMMTQKDAMTVLASHRGERIVVTTMTAAGIWPSVSQSPTLDFVLLPSAMGHAPSLGHGLALAQPQRGVIVVNGDGCTLMSLGNLVTLANHPANLFIVVMDNGLYEVTGGQTTAGAGRTDFAGLARAAGIGRTYKFETLEAWQKGAAEAVSGTGPALIWLKVEGRHGQKTPKAPWPMKEQVARLRQALNAG
ncbi:MAG TPA: thiamine pyrophosphate-dependent enzyme [Gemmataceae bacterium]|nr:thiamine pyrophosphate-dependent enzyme [Gemmataceae bacterium]